MKRCFEKNGAAKDFHFKKKNQFEKYGIISSWGLWLSTRDDPFFWPPEKSQFMSVILSPCLFPVIHTPKEVMDLKKIENRKKFFKNSGFRNSNTLNFYNNVIQIFSKRFKGRFSNYPVD